MKRWFCILIAGCLLGFCGCAKSEQESADTHQELVLYTQDETGSGKTAQTETTVPETGKTTGSQPASGSTQTQQETAHQMTAAAASSEPVTANGAGTADANSAAVQTETSSVVQNESTAPAEGIYGAEGRTEEEWMVLGQDLYRQAMETAFRYLCSGSAFPIDTEHMEIIDRTYFLTTCPSFEEATAPYYEIFSKAYHAGDFDGILLEQDGKLYTTRGARGMDISYLSSEITELVSVSEDAVVFTVSSQYEDSETTAEFTLVPEDGLWKVGEFTLPY